MVIKGEDPGYLNREALGKTGTTKDSGGKNRHENEDIWAKNGSRACCAPH